MAQPSKKSSHKAHAKIAHSASAKSCKSFRQQGFGRRFMSALETSRSSAESMFKIGTDTVKEFFSSGSEEAQKAHEKFFAIGRESTENVSRAVDALTRTLSDFVSVARENADAAVEVNHIAADIAKSINSELVNCANTNFSDNVEICKEAFTCRDINDMFDLHSKWLSVSMDNFFNQSTRLAEMVLQLATEAAEPINERVAEATERFSKTLAA